jgi:hypothetical protein
MVSYYRNTKSRAQAIFAEYGRIFFMIMMTLWISEWAIWTTLMYYGAPIDSVLAYFEIVLPAESQLMAFVGIAFVCTQATKLPRLAGTAALTPVVARTVRGDAGQQPV